MNIYQSELKDGQMLILERVLDENADLSKDLEMGVTALANAFKNATTNEIQEHFHGPDNIHDYYRELINEYDIAPFRAGKLIWVRAFLQNQPIGWMGLEADFMTENTTYISTIVLDPNYQGRGIGEKMIATITDHWLPKTTEINLIVRSINHHAMNFFAKLGFVPAKDIEHHYIENSQHCLFMRWRKP